MPGHVLTLIAADSAKAEIEPIAAESARALGGRIDWLAPKRACDILFERPLDRMPDVAAGVAAIDAVMQRADGRRKRLLIADLESTIIENEMLDDMAERLGVRARVAEITRRAMNGEIDFVASLRERVALFKGQPDSLLSDVARGMRIMAGAKTLVATMRAHGAKAVLISGGFHAFSRGIADALGFERDYANELIVTNGTLTGTLREPVFDAAGKRDTLLACAAEFGLEIDATMAVGDGANDLPMLAAAGLGVAFHPKPHVRDRIATRIEHTDLTSLLFIQGYRTAEFTG